MTAYKKIIWGSVVACLFAALPLAQAQNAPEPDRAATRWHSGQRVQEIYSQLNLTDEQKKQLEANKHQHRAKMESVRHALKADKEALKEELMKSQLDMPKINGIHQQIKALQSQMEDIKLSSVLTVRSILTPEQFSKFVTLMRRHKQEHEE